MTVRELFVWCCDRGVEEFRVCDDWGLGVCWDDVEVDRKNRKIVVKGVR